jgi:hypothetical protein
MYFNRIEPQLKTTDFWQGCKDNSMRKKRVFLRNGGGAIVYEHEKE